MKFLYTQSVPDTNICSYIKNSIEDPDYEDGVIFSENLINMDITFSGAISVPLLGDLPFSSDCAMVLTK